MYETFNFIINLSYTRHNMLSQSLSVFFFNCFFIFVLQFPSAQFIIDHTLLFVSHSTKKGEGGDEQLNKINKLKVNKQQMKTTYNN